MSLRSFARKYYKFVTFNLGKRDLEFDYSTLPWIDQDDADINSFVAQFPIAADYPYDLKEKLEFWKKNGYVVFEKAIPEEVIDSLWSEIEDTIDNHDKYKMTALVYQFNNTKDTAIKDIPVDKLRSIGARINEYHNPSVQAKKVVTYPSIAPFLKAVFNDQVAVYQSLIFRYGSQQDTHQDFPWVTPTIPSHLAASWIALEDVHPDSGPLYYYPGSHKVKKFNFGNGILYKYGESVFGPKLFSKYLDWRCKGEGLVKETLLIKKGDVLIWHSALAHGGHRINNSKLTRKSLVCHYTTTSAYMKHKFKRDENPTISYHNEIAIYANPLIKEEEDILAFQKAS
jgi:ectoine hydroxylase-related dioxygenase (phytanoyl-CoA dioxygenase family)